MSNSNERVDVQIGAETGKMQSGFQSAQRMVSDFANFVDNQFKKISSSTQSVAKQTQSVADQFQNIKNIAVGSAFAYLGKQILDVMSNFEQLEIRMRSVMGGIKEGEQATAWIKTFAKNTPLEVNQVTEAFIRLKNYGLNPMDGTLQAITDQSAKFGNVQETLGRISLAVGQAWSKQKLQGNEILQLTEAGVPVWDMLSRVTGKNVAELQKLSEQGKLGRDVIKALIDEMGRASGGAAHAQMETMSGKWSNFVDTVTNALDVFRKGGALDGIKNIISDVTEGIGKLEASGALEQWASAAATVVNDVVAVLRELWGIVQELGSIVVEVFSVIGSVIVGESNEASEAMSLFGTVLEMIRIAAIGLKTGIVVVWESIKYSTAALVTYVQNKWSEWSESFAVVVELFRGYFNVLGGLMQTFAAVAIKVFDMDFEGAKTAWSAGIQGIADEVEESANRITKIHETGVKERAANTAWLAEQEQKSLKKIEDTAQGAYKAIFDRPVTGAAKGGGGGGGASPAGGGGGASVSVGGEGDMKAWAAQLEAMKARFQLENSLREMSISAEMKFWQDKINLTKSGSEERNAIEQKILDLKVKQAKQTHDQEMAMKRAEVDTARMLSDARLQNEMQNSQLLLSEGKITAEQHLSNLQAFEDRRFEIARKATEDRLALLKLETKDNAAEIARLQAELERQAVEHAGRKRQIEHESYEESMQLWQSLGDSMSSLWDKGVNAMMNGTLRWRNAMKAIGAELVRWFAVEVVGKKVKAWAAGQAAEVAANMWAKTVIVAQEMWAVTKSLAITAWGAIKRIAIYAYEAAAAAFKAVAGIPYIGPFLAVAASAAALATVGGLAKSIASARGGYDVPAGVNPMTQLHEKEMVLPAKYADVIRSMSDGSIGGGGGDTYNFTLNAVDARSVKRLLRDNRDEIAQSLRRKARELATMKV